MADGVSSDPKIGDEVPYKFKSWFASDKDHYSDWRDEAEVAYDFVAGRQYTAAEEKALKSKMRPIITFNRTGVIVDSIHGHEIGNRREVRYIPREQGDVKPNEMLTGAGEWFRDESLAEDEESDAFLDMLISGMGWTETLVDFEESEEGTPSVDRVDPLECLADFNAKKRNLRDARRVWRYRQVPLSEAQMIFPDNTSDELDASWAQSSFSSATTNQDGDEQDGDSLVTIVQCQWIDMINKIVSIDPTTGQKEEYSTKEFAVLEKHFSAMGIKLPKYPVRRKVRRQAFFGNSVLEIGDAPCPDEFSLQCITGKRDRNAGIFFGIVRPMMDPQRWANKWLSQLMHIMNTNSKGGLMAEAGAFEDKAKAERSWADPSAITHLKKGAISQNMVKEKPPAAFPIGFQHLTEFGISSIRDVAGVSVEMLGMRETNQPASLEAARKQAGMTILQPFFDALKQYRVKQGRVVLHYIQEVLSDGRLIKIGGEGSEQYVPLMREASSEYDIIVDDAPTSPNQKEFAWGLLMQMAPMMGKNLDPQMLAALLAYSPLPSNIVAEIKKMATQKQEQAAPVQQAQQQMAKESHQVEVAKAASEAEENKADAAYKNAQAQTEMLGAVFGQLAA